MATINGIGIRGYQEEETHRGVAYRGTLSMDGLNIGFFEHKGEGGDAEVFVDNHNKAEFDRRIKDYFDKHPATMDDNEGFLNELINLMISELEFKKNAQGGILLEGHRIARTTPLDVINDLDDLGIDFYVAKTEDEVAELLEKHHPAWYRVFRELNDFNL